MGTRIKVGDPFPAFEMKDQDGKAWTLDDLRGHKAILYFYPVDDTPGCTKESCDFRDNHSLLKAQGYLLFGISPQDEGSHRAFAEKFNLPFPLLVDDDHKLADELDVYGPQKFGEHTFEANLRSTFVIDGQGYVTEAEYGVKYKGHVDRLKETLGL